VNQGDGGIKALAKWRLTRISSIVKEYQQVKKGQQDLIKGKPLTTM